MTVHPEAGRVDPIAGDVRAVRRDGHERCGAGKIKAALERRGMPFQDEEHKVMLDNLRYADFNWLFSMRNN